MPPLNPEEYGTGRTVRHESGEDFTVFDTIILASGNRLLVLRDVDGDLHLLPEGDVRDEWEARSPGDVEKDREAAQATPTNPDPAPTNPDGNVVSDNQVSGVPGVTGPAAPPADSPPPAPNPQ